MQTKNARDLIKAPNLADKAFGSGSEPTYLVGVKGISPLLMHAFPQEKEASLNDKTRPKSGAKLTIPEQAELHAYRMLPQPEQKSLPNLCIPGYVMFAAIVGAGIFQKEGRRTLTTSAGSLVPGGLSLYEHELDLGTATYHIDSRKITNKNTGNAQMCHRPMLHEWAVGFRLVVDDDYFAEAVVRKLVEDAGLRLGLMAFRPQKKGIYGRFRIDHWERIDARKVDAYM